MKFCSVLKILMSAGVNYPVLSDLGFSMNRVPTLIVDPGQTVEAVRLLSSPNSCPVDEYAQENRIREALVSTHSSYVIIPYSGQKGGRIISILCSILRTGTVNALPMLVTEKPFVDDPENSQFFVFSSDSLSGYSLTWDSVVPPQNSLPVVYEKCIEAVNGTASPEERFWLAAACFLFPLLDQGEYEETLDTAKQMVEMDESCRESDDICNEFLELMNEWQKKERFNAVFELPYPGDSAIGNKESSIFFDEESFYLHETLFKKICQPLFKYIPLRILKSRLQESDILKVDRSGGYTVKRTYYDDDNVRKSMRLMRFDRNNTKAVGNLDLVTACELRKEA